MIEAFATFADALRSRNIIPPSKLIADGEWHRCDVDSKHGKADGTYRLFADKIGGLYENHQDGLGVELWQAERPTRMSTAEFAKHCKDIERKKIEAEARRQTAYAAARFEAGNICRKVSPAKPNHPYLARKRVRPHNIGQIENRLLTQLLSDKNKSLLDRLKRSPNDDTLVVRMIADGVDQSLQFILSNGEKFFLSGGRIKGCSRKLEGRESELILCEGYTTGASIREATDATVYITFSAENLTKIACKLRATNPNARIVVAADDDAESAKRTGRNNTGIEKATEAALQAGALIAIPSEPGDFNDLFLSKGPEAVKECIDSARAPTDEKDYATITPNTNTSITTVDRSMRNRTAESPSNGKGASTNGNGATATSETDNKDQQKLDPYVNMGTVKPEQVEWLWPGRIPYKKITLIDGDPGLGKTLIVLDIAARLTTGKEMPLEEISTQSPSSVIIVTAEDGLADTIRPRLDAAGADASKVEAFDFTKATFVMPGSLEALEKKIKDTSARLVVLDPLMAFLGKADSHKDQDIRALLVEVGAIAERTGVAVVVIRHLNKVAGGQAIYRGGGSIGIAGAARSVLLVAMDPENPNQRVVAPIKNNLCAPPQSLKFCIKGNGNNCGVEWLGASSFSADELVAPPDNTGKRRALSDAKDFLLEILEDGSVESNEIFQQGKKAGHAERTLWRAKLLLGVQAKRKIEGDNKSPWVWEMPASSDMADWAEWGKTVENPNKFPVRHSANGKDVGGVEKTAEKQLNLSSLPSLPNYSSDCDPDDIAEGEL